jgi:flagellar assembly factor FliW
MTSDDKNNEATITVASTRFGEFSIGAESVITFPSGLIGFPRCNRFVMIDHKPPFSWLQSIDDPSLAFVVIDGFEFGQAFELKPPIGDHDIGLKEEDEFAILVIVTIRPDPKMTTANLKAPLFVNVTNRKGVQIIFDKPQLSTRHLLWEDDEAKDGEQKNPEKK